MRLILTTVLALSCLSLASPKKETLSNSNWTGLLNVPDPVKGILEFKSDSLFVYVGPDLLETMTYTLKGDTLVLKKVDGRSSCDNQPADYKFVIKEDLLKIESLNDSCSERKTAFSAEGYTRVK